MPSSVEGERHLSISLCTHNGFILWLRLVRSSRQIGTSSPFFDAAYSVTKDGIIKATCLIELSER